MRTEHYSVGTKLDSWKNIQVTGNLFFGYFDTKVPATAWIHIHIIGKVNTEKADASPLRLLFLWGWTPTQGSGRICLFVHQLWASLLKKEWLKKRNLPAEADAFSLFMTEHDLCWISVFECVHVQACFCSLSCSSCQRGMLLIQSPWPKSKLVPLLPCSIFECREAQVGQEVAPVSGHRGGVSVVRKTKGGRNGTRNCWRNQKQSSI